MLKSQVSFKQVWWFQTTLREGSCSNRYRQFRSAAAQKSIWNSRDSLNSSYSPSGGSLLLRLYPSCLSLPGAAGPGVGVRTGPIQRCSGCVPAAATAQLCRPPCLCTASPFCPPPHKHTLPVALQPPPAVLTDPLFKGSSFSFLSPFLRFLYVFCQ